MMEAVAFRDAPYDGGDGIAEVDPGYISDWSQADLRLGRDIPHEKPRLFFGQAHHRMTTEENIKGEAWSR